MCPPQPSFAHPYELSTIRLYHAARSVDAEGVNLSTALLSGRSDRAHAEDTQSLRLDGEERLYTVRGLDDDTKRRAATAAQGEEQVLVLALVRRAIDAIRGDDLHLDLRKRAQLSMMGAVRHRLDPDVPRDQLRDHTQAIGCCDRRPTCTY